LAGLAETAQQAETAAVAVAVAVAQVANRTDRMK
jgi:hypothetical protein